MSTPYEWYGDNFIAYVVSVIEEEALGSLATYSSATMAAKIAVDKARERFGRVSITAI